MQKRREKKRKGKQNLLSQTSLMCGTWRLLWGQPPSSWAEHASYGDQMQKANRFFTCLVWGSAPGHWALRQQLALAETRLHSQWEIWGPGGLGNSFYSWSFNSLHFLLELYNLSAQPFLFSPRRKEAGSHPPSSIGASPVSIANHLRLLLQVAAALTWSLYTLRHWIILSP